MNDSLEEQKKHLAVLIRRFRKSAGLTGTQLGNMLGWGQSRISRMETAHQPPSEYEAKEIAKALKLSRKEQTELIEAVRQFDVEFVSVRSSATKGAQQRQDEIRAIESSSSSIKMLTLTVVPSLLQTPDYTRALCKADFEAENWTEVEIEGAVEMRKERQKILNNKKKHFSFLLLDTALWLRYGSNSAMRQQLEYLLDCTSDTRFRFGIIPRTASVGTMPMCGFKIHDDKLVIVEGITGEFNLAEPEDISRYHQAFDVLSSSALTGKQAKKLVEEAISEIF